MTDREPPPTEDVELAETVRHLAEPQCPSGTEVLHVLDIIRSSARTDQIYPLPVSSFDQLLGELSVLRRPFRPGFDESLIARFLCAS